MRLLLDTSVLIDALRGRGAGRAAARVACDRRAGPVDLRDQRRGASAAALRLGGCDWRFAEAELAGRWRRDFARRGVTLGQADCLIAAAAVGIGAQLATGNPKHFPMDELVVDHWPAGA